jgi:hypothetical protein
MIRRTNAVLLLGLMLSLLAGFFAPHNAWAFDKNCYAYGYTPYQAPGGPYPQFGYGFANCGGDSLGIRGRLQELSVSGSWLAVTGWYYNSYGYAPSARDFYHSLTCSSSSVRRYYRVQVQYSFDLIPYVDTGYTGTTVYGYTGYMNVTCL